MSFYIPVLKWKRGERVAIVNLAPEIKKRTIPFFEVPPPPPVSQKTKDKNKDWQRKSLNNWLGNFGDEYKECSIGKACFIDTHLIKSENIIMPDGKKPLDFILNEVFKRKLEAIPVLELNSSEDTLKIIDIYNLLYDFEICLRLKLADLLDAGIELGIKNLIKRFNLSLDKVHLQLDIAKPERFEPVDAFIKMLQSNILKIPNLNKYKSFFISASSFPHNMKEVAKPYDLVKRKEWAMYKALLAVPKIKGFNPIFSDYGIRPTGYNNADFSNVRIPNKLIYTTNDAWLIYRGATTSHDGYAEYRKICAFIKESKYFMKKEYSYGDAYIYNCAMGIKPKNGTGTGNPEKWIQVGTNHHLTKVVNDLSNIVSS